MNIVLRISILFLLCISCHAKEIPNCKFEDTVDLSNTERLANGSYLYDQNVLVPPDQVGIYDYEELSNGERVPLPPHPRGCACKERGCIRFCCHPTKEVAKPAMHTRECRAATAEDAYDPSVNVMLENGVVEKRNAITNFTINQAAPCPFFAILTHRFDIGIDWAVFENGTLVQFSVRRVRKWTYIINKKFYCITPSIGLTGRMELATVICPFRDPKPKLRVGFFVIRALTIPFLILTLLVYACIEELRNLHGKCFMNYLASLAVGCTLLYSVFMCSDEFKTYLITTKWCQFIGYIGYFVILCAFFWVNVMSFDLWETLRRTAPLRSGLNKRFSLYSTYVWGMSLCLTTIVIAIDNSNVNNSYKPGIADTCWIDYTKWSALFYYYGAQLITLIVDLIFFRKSKRKINSMKKDIDKMLAKGGSRKNNKMQHDKNSFELFYRLFITMAVVWIFDTIAYMERVHEPEAPSLFYYLQDLLNALVGPVIFRFFILNRNVWKIIKRKFYRMCGVPDYSEIEEETTMTDSDDQLSITTIQQ